MTLQGHIQNGVIVFDPAVALPEGATVEVVVVAEKENAGSPVSTEDEIPTLLERMQGFVGKFDGLPPDASVNHDHYLYGTPRRQ